MVTPLRLRPRQVVETILLASVLYGWALTGVAGGETILLEFSSPICGPCRSMEPIVNRLAVEGMPVQHVDVTRRPDVAAQFHVDSWPTFIALVDGHEQARLVGATGREEIVGMMQHATDLAANSAPGGGRGASGSVVSPVALGGSNPFASRTTFADGSGGKIVEMQQPKPRMAVGAGSRTPDASPLGASPVATMNSPSSVGGVSIASLITATVRLSIEDPDGRSTGTGTIVDSRSGEALIVTCGHLFRTAGDKGAIEITTFASGPSGAVVSGTLPGRLVHYDLERDLALVSFRPTAAITVAPIAGPGEQLTPGDGVTAVGCNHGDNPTAWPTKIAAVNRYQGFPNVEAAGAPVEGRSGGGLFSDEGKLVGVCFAAEPKEDEGLYSSLNSIQAKLDSLGLAMIYKSPQGVGGAGAPADQLAAMSRPPVIRGQDPGSSEARPLQAPPAAATAPFYNEASPGAASLGAASLQRPAAQSPASPPFSPAPATLASATIPATTPLSTSEQAAVEEIQRRGADAEVICIIHPHGDAGPSEVIKLNAASPALVAALHAAGDSSRVSPAVATAPASGWMK